MPFPPSHPSSDHREDGSPKLYCDSELPMHGDSGFGIAGAFEKHNNFVPPSPRSPYSFCMNVGINEALDRLLSDEDYFELEEPREFLARKRAPRSQRRRSLNVSGAGTSLAEGTTSQVKFHKGVRKIRDGRYTSRVCVPGEKRKMELGECNFPNQAACTYRIAAKYLKKPFSSTPEEVEFLKNLPPVPDSLSPAAKLAWIKKTARQYSSESPYVHRDGLGDASPPMSTTLQQPDAVWCSFLVSTSPNDGMFGSSNSALTASPSAPLELCADVQNGPTLRQPDAAGSSSFISTPVNDGTFDSTVLTTSGSLVPQGRMNGVLGSDPEKRAETPVPNVDGTPPDQVFASEPRMTDSIVSASSELRVLVSLPRTQQAAPALLMTESIISAFYELRQQGWEVQLTTRQIEETE